MVIQTYKVSSRPFPSPLLCSCVYIKNQFWKVADTYKCAQPIGETFPILHPFPFVAVVDSWLWSCWRSTLVWAPALGAVELTCSPLNLFVLVPSSPIPNKFVKNKKGITKPVITGVHRKTPLLCLFGIKFYYLFIPFPMKFFSDQPIPLRSHAQWVWVSDLLLSIY